jgi:hypothetical protein
LRHITWREWLFFCFCRLIHGRNSLGPPNFKTKISFSYAIFWAWSEDCFILKMFRQICGSVCKFLTDNSSFLNTSILYTIQSNTALLLLAHHISGSVSHHVGSCWNGLHQTTGLLEEASITSRHNIILYFKAIEFRC